MEGSAFPCMGREGETDAISEHSVGFPQALQTVLVLIVGGEQRRAGILASLSYSSTQRRVAGGREFFGGEPPRQRSEFGDLKTFKNKKTTT